MTWTPLITAANFTGIQTDLLTAVTGIMALLLIVVGLGVLARAISR